MGALILLLAAALDPGAGLLVLVPAPTSAQTCVIHEAAASAIDLSPGLRLVRDRLRSGEDLAAARARVGADIAVAGAIRTAPPGLGAAQVELSAKGSATKTLEDTGPKATVLHRLLAKLWPQGAPPLVTYEAFAAASPEVLAAACNRDAATALAGSGAALHEAVARLVEPPAEWPARLPMLMAWARARAELAAPAAPKRKPPCSRRSERDLTAVLAGLRAGDTAPTWRRSPGEAHPASAAQIDGGTAIIFENGQFTAIDLQTGDARWTRPVGRAEPALIDAGSGLWLAVANRAVLAIDGRTGEVRWRLEVVAPAPEVAVAGDLIFVAGKERLVAIQRADGAVRWSKDLNAAPTAGPVLINGLLALPVDTEIKVMDPASGADTGHLPVGDEISGPVVAGDDQRLWTVIGGETIIAVDPTHTTTVAGALPLLAARFDAFLGATWPPPLASDKLLITAQHPRRGPFLAYLDRTTGEVIETHAGSRGPLLALGDLSGVVHLDARRRAVVARDQHGKRRWSTVLPDVVNAVEIRGDLVWVAAGDTLTALDARNGRRARRIVLDEVITSIAFGADRGLVTVESGAVYGLPGTNDPRTRYWLERARFDLARCYIANGQRKRAESMAEDIIRRDPDDLDALALLARATEARRPGVAAQMWSRISRRAPRGDPLQAAATDALRLLIGLKTRLMVDTPIAQVVTSSDGAVVIRAGDRLLGIDPTSATQPAWTAPAQPLLQAAGSAIVVGATLVTAATGQTLRSLGTDGYTFAPVGSIRKGDGASIVVEGRDGRPLWSRKFEHATVRTLAATEAVVLVGDDGPRGFVHALETQRGAALWMRPFDMATLEAIPAGSTVLIRGADTLVGVATSTGEVAFRMKAPKAPLTIYPLRSGWVLDSAGHLLVIDEEGKARRRMRRPTDATALVVDPQSERGFALLPGGRLAALELGRGRAGKVLELGAFDQISAAAGQVVAVEAGGHAVLVLDAELALR